MGEERPKRQVLNISGNCTFEEQSDGTWNGAFVLFDITATGASRDECFQAIVQQIQQTVEVGDDGVKAAWERYVQENVEEQEIPEEEVRAQQDMIARSHEASKRFRVLTAQNLEEAMAASKPVLVDFWAEWCMPCHMMAPVLKEVADDLVERLEVAKFNVDDNREALDAWDKFSIQGIPTLILFANGQERTRVIGAGRTKEQLIAELEPYLG